MNSVMSNERVIIQGKTYVIKEEIGVASCTACSFKDKVSSFCRDVVKKAVSVVFNDVVEEDISFCGMDSHIAVEDNEYALFKYLEIKLNGKGDMNDDEWEV